MTESTQDNDTTCIVMSMEAQFHGVHEEGRNSKLIQFPRGGLLWGLHLSLQKNEAGATSKVVGSLICFGPMKEHSPDWTITFDNVFTISCKRVGWGGKIKKNTTFSDSQHIVNNYEWEGQNATTINWDNYQDLKLSCHLYISKTTGFNRDVLKEGASLTSLQDYMTVPTSRSQVECQVTKVFSDLLAEERIVFSDERMEAVEKLATFFTFPHVIETCRRYLMISQSGILAGSMRIARKVEFNLTGFAYKENSADRKERMDNLRESDIVGIFQQLCSIAFQQP